MSAIFRFKISLVSLFIIFGAGFVPHNGWAYYQTIEPSKAFEPVSVPTELGKLKNISGIAVYENLPDDEYQLSGNSRFLPANWEYTPIDIISLKKTIPLRYSSTLNSENQLSQLIYADIEIKRLIEEYSRLQNNAHSFGSGSKNKINVARTTLALTGRDTSSMYASRQLHEREKQELTRIAMRHMDTSQEINLLMSLTEFVKKMKQDTLDKNAKEILFSEDKDLTNFKQTTVGMSDNEDGVGFDNPNNIGRKKERGKMNGVVKQPPQIINLMAIAIGYFLNNKIEAMFFLTLLSTILILFLKVLKRLHFG